MSSTLPHVLTGYMMILLSFKNFSWETFSPMNLAFGELIPVSNVEKNVLACAGNYRNLGNPGNGQIYCEDIPG